MTLASNFALFCFAKCECSYKWITLQAMPTSFCNLCWMVLMSVALSSEQDHLALQVENFRADNS